MIFGHFTFRFLGRFMLHLLREAYNSYSVFSAGSWRPSEPVVRTSREIAKTWNRNKCSYCYAELSANGNL